MGHYIFDRNNDRLFKEGDIVRILEEYFTHDLIRVIMDDLEILDDTGDINPGSLWRE